MTDRWDGWIGMVMIGHGYSKSTFGANNEFLRIRRFMVTAQGGYFKSGDSFFIGSDTITVAA